MLESISVCTFSFFCVCVLIIYLYFSGLIIFSSFLLVLLCFIILHLGLFFYFFFSSAQSLYLQIFLWFYLPSCLKNTQVFELCVSPVLLLIPIHLGLIILVTLALDSYLIIFMHFRLFFDQTSFFCFNHLFFFPVQFFFSLCHSASLPSSDLSPFGLPLTFTRIWLPLITLSGSFVISSLTSVYVLLTFIHTSLDPRLPSPCPPYVYLCFLDTACQNDDAKMK